MIGNEKDGDNSLSVSFSGKTRYKDDQQKLSLSGSFNASKSKDSGEPLSIDTEKGSAELRYDKPIAANLDLFALSNYQYDGTNDSGVNTVLGNIGVAFPLLKSETTELTLSIGPSLQWSGGGITCASDTFCGNSYGGATLTADLSWKPWPSLQFGLQNQFTAVWANEVQPGNTLTAEVRYYPQRTASCSQHCGAIDLPKHEHTRVEQHHHRSGGRRLDDNTHASPRWTQNRSVPCSPSPTACPAHSCAMESRLRRRRAFHRSNPGTAGH